MQKNNRFSEFIGYIEELSRCHSEIQNGVDGRKHFIRLDTDELDNSIKQTLGFPVVCMDRYSANLSGQDSNRFKKRGITLMFLDYVSDVKNYDRIHTVWDNCESIADDFISRIYNDVTAGKVPGVMAMDLSEVEYELAGNKSINLYGVVVTFTVSFRFCEFSGSGNFE